MPDPEPEIQLESQICQDLRFLIVDHGARLLSRERLPGAGNSQVLVQVLGMLLRVIQKEGSVTVLVAPTHRRNDWHAIEYLLMAVDPHGEFPPRPVYGSLAELSTLLKPRLSLLNDALSLQRFALTLQESRQHARKGLITLEPRLPIPLSLGKRALLGAVRGIAWLLQFLSLRPKDGYAKTMPVGSDEKLEESVRREFASLFSQHGAKLSSNGRLRIMDFASITIDVGNFRLRAARDRGSLEVSIAPLHATRYWQSLGEAFLAIQQQVETPESLPSSILRGAGPRIEAEFVRLDEAFSEAKFPATRERIREIRRSLEKAWIEDWNRDPNRRYRATTS